MPDEKPNPKVVFKTNYHVEISGAPELTESIAETIKIVNAFMKAALEASNAVRKQVGLRDLSRDVARDERSH